MRTKIVYVVVSAESDSYFEQAWVSAWSARQHEPSARIVLLADSDTVSAAKKSMRRNGLALFDETVTHDFAPNVPNKVRSRYLKTSMRNLLPGDFLFVDSDTVITGPLGHVDDFGFDLGMVQDLNSPFSELPCAESVRKRIRHLFGAEIPDGMQYFNSGVIFARDTPKVHAFFESWHKNWKHACGKGVVFDQPPLCKTDMDAGGFITCMDGGLNCQIRESLAYLHAARIIHFFQSSKEVTPVSPFFGDELYARIKDEGRISDEMGHMILCCKASFSFPSMALHLEEANFRRTNTYKAAKILYHNKFTSLPLKIAAKLFMKMHG